MTVCTIAASAVLIVVVVLAALGWAAYTVAMDR